MLKKIFQILQSRSLIDYDYYHLYSNRKLALDYTVNGYKKNYIVYILKSHFTIGYSFLNSIIGFESITDVFLERLEFTSPEKHLFFSMVFKDLFWLRLNTINIEESDYDGFSNFMNSNSLDINRIFIEQSELKDSFIEKLSTKKGFGNLTFINFDNNFISDTGVEYLLLFLEQNSIDLEYLSLAGNNISVLGTKQILEHFQYSKQLRILDLSRNRVDQDSVFNFIKHNTFIKELFVNGMTFSNTILDLIIELFEKEKMSIYIFRFTLQKNQEKYKQVFDDLGKKLGITFDISEEPHSSPLLRGEGIEQMKNITPLSLRRGVGGEVYYSTIYIKGSKGEEYRNIKDLENNYFYYLDTYNIDIEFERVLKKGDPYFKNGINLFLFDFHDYRKIKYLLEVYNFNYIYLENYHISDEDFIFFIQTIASLGSKKYKINLHSIEISQFQLDYLMENIPENIFYIEVNLNKINKKETYIKKMLKNSAFMFENMELYAKIFK